MIARTSSAAVVPSKILSQIQTAFAPRPKGPLSRAIVQARKDSLGSLAEQISKNYKYRLPDATARKDIEYYRDPAHRGYLSHKIKEGESPSLYFKVPGLAKDRGKQAAKKSAAKASAENKLF